MEGGEDGGEAHAADAAEDDVEGHVDLRVLAVELLGGDVDAAAGGDEDADGLVDGVDAVEDVGGVGGGDGEDVDGVDEAVDDAVLGLGADGELAAGGGEGVVAEGGFGGDRGRGFVVGGGKGEGEAGLAEGGERGEGAGGGEPLAGLEKDVGAVCGLEGEGEARHGFGGGAIRNSDLGASGREEQGISWCWALENREILHSYTTYHLI